MDDGVEPKRVDTLDCPKILKAIGCNLGHNQ